MMDQLSILHFFGAQTGTQYNLGRTLTHEVGHWLNLRHTWGNGGANTDCASDDQVTDTPKTNGPTYTCAVNRTSCGLRTMVQNYMDYPEDACMVLFSQGQSARMRAVLATGGARSTLPLTQYSGVVPGVTSGTTTTTGAAASTTTTTSGNGATGTSTSANGATSTSASSTTVTSTSSSSDSGELSVIVNSASISTIGMTVIISIMVLLY